MQKWRTVRQHCDADFWSDHHGVSLATLVYTSLSQVRMQSLVLSTCEMPYYASWKEKSLFVQLNVCIYIGIYYGSPTSDRVGKIQPCGALN